MRKDKLYIIGVAPEGASSLSPATKRQVKQADIVFGGERLLQMFTSLTCQKVVIKNNLAGVADEVKSNLGLKRMVVLASGDPGFFGIARHLTGKLGKQAVEVIPNVSAIQLAFARIKESWDDATLVSAHSRPVEDIVESIRHSRKIGILTDDKNTPNIIGRVLRENGFENCRVYVCQDLGSKNERIISTRLNRLEKLEFSPLSVMVLIRENLKESPERLLGIPDDVFYQRKGRSLITKTEVRAISLAKMCLTERSTVWDIGAGSGAISVEASLLAGKGKVFAIEKNPDDVFIIRKNIKKFGRFNIKVVQTVAPGGLEQLPDPDSVFIGGSGGNMKAILDYVSKRLKPGGHVVINVATLENLQQTVSGLEANGFAAETTLVNIARSKDIAELTRLESLNPVFVVSGKQHGL